MPLESKRIAALLLTQPDETAWRHAVEIDNILQKKTPATARRQATLIRRRLATLDAQGWEECTPVYLEFPGWEENTHGITEWDKLPPAARAYLRALEELAGCPLSIVSTGPDRDHTMVLQDPFA